MVVLLESVNQILGSIFASLVSLVFPWGLALLEWGILPDVITRFAIRLLLRQRLAGSERDGNVTSSQEREERFIDELRACPTIAIETRKANEQHYEVPPEYFLLCLGPRLKYSACEFAPSDTLKSAEDATFELYAKRAQLKDGMTILDMGCGWGSLSLWLLEKFKTSKVIAVSNSKDQRGYIEAQASQRGFSDRLTVITANINDFDEIQGSSLDRVMSIEMLEHCKNYELLFGRVSRWLKPGGKAFIHIFTHAGNSYHFDVVDERDWMAKHFFSGGTMPSHELLQRFQSSQFVLQSKWKQNGIHYSRTLEAWLQLMDANRAKVEAVFAKCYGAKDVGKWVARWRTFYLACSELFRFRNGNQWHVTHYLFERPLAK